MRRVALALLVIVACDRSRTAAPPVRTIATVAPKHRTEPRPTLPPLEPTTAMMWSAAEASRTPASWDAVAEAYDRELVGCETDCAETAYAVVLARKNALEQAPAEPPEGEAPAPLPPRLEAMVTALDQYVALADPADPDVAGASFTAAHALWKFRQPDAIDRLHEILRDHAADPVAEYAANLLLDMLMKANRTDELRIVVTELLANPAFLAGKDELRQTLVRVQTMLADDD